MQSNPITRYLHLSLKLMAGRQEFDELTAEDQQLMSKKTIQELQRRGTSAGPGVVSQAFQLPFLTTWQKARGMI